MKIPILAVAKARARITRSGHAYTPQKTKEYEKELQWYFTAGRFQMLPVMPTLLDVIVYLPRPKKKPKFYYPITKPDCDNLLKAICDAGNGFLWKDDNQLVDTRIRKRFAEDGPQVHIIAQTIEATL